MRLKLKSLTLVVWSRKRKFWAYTVVFPQQKRPAKTAYWLWKVIFMQCKYIYIRFIFVSHNKESSAPRWKKIRESLEQQPHSKITTLLGGHLLYFYMHKVEIPCSFISCAIIIEMILDIKGESVCRLDIVVLYFHELRIEIS